MCCQRSISVKLLSVIWFLVLLSCLTSTTLAGEYRAYSLTAAERLLRSKKDVQSDVRVLGGITQPVAFVLNEVRNELILVGQVNPTYSKIRLDDLVVAMRAVLKHREAPLVSIDPAPEGSPLSEQVVRFAGKIENTQFGRDLLDADVFLKKLGLGKINAEVWGVRSYLDLSAEEWRRTGKEDGVLSRFWFLVDPGASAVATRKGVGLVKRLKIKVQTEVSARTVGGRYDKTTNSADSLGEAFAESLTANLDDVMLAMPELRRLDQLYRLVGVASLIERWRDQFGMKLSLDYWLTRVPIKKVITEPTYPLLSSSAERGPGSGASTMTISGGVELRALVTDVRSGSLTALRNLVLKSKPHNSALTWEVPLGDSLDALADVAGAVSLPTTAVNDAGMNLRTQFNSPTSVSLPVKWSRLHVLLACEAEPVQHDSPSGTRPSAKGWGCAAEQACSDLGRHFWGTVVLATCPWR